MIEKEGRRLTMSKFEANVAFMQQPENARARALLKSMGYTSRDLKQPRIGVANSWGETSPGHFHLRAIADAVKAGIWQAGGTPFEFCSFGMCPVDVGGHGIRYDTATRDIVAAEIEAAAWLHMFDGLVMISSCDKNVPANLLAAARLDLPVIIITGGPMMAGRYKGEDLDTTSVDVHCWAYGVGKESISLEALSELEDAACAGSGACALLGTANTMQCLTEALGLSLPGVATTPAVSGAKLRQAKETGAQIVTLIREGITSSKIITKNSLRNAIRVLHAIGGSTNAVIHLLALAYEMRFDDDITLQLIERMGRDTPCITAVRPSGPYTMQDFHEAGGIQQVMKRMTSSLHTDALTVTGKTLGANLAATQETPSKVIRAVSDPVFKEGLAVLSGTLARSAVVRPTVVVKEMMRHCGPAKVFNGQEEALMALRKGAIEPGDVLVVRYEGPKGGPGLTEVFKVIGFLRALGLESKCALITDGKISGFAKGPFICQVSPEAADGGPLAVVRDGDLIEMDIPNRTLNLLLPETEIQERIANWKAPPPRVKDGFLTVYARLANPTEKGAGINLRLD
jgi:dihydroxy-acid dehydratase